TCLSTIAFVTKSSELFSREVIITWALLGYAIQTPPYLLLHFLSRHYHERNSHHYNSLIIGSDGVALKLADSFIQQNQFPLVGVVSASPFE
ncbi:undecaprenyl-phosphate glucose phosphotransferase, partial [Pseudomonas sp. CCC2.2]|nr:undecaprenyl-phosphate glucose phosphotransferase [Pseudomonas sp. CCC2.2]